jgi:hypothetical protein
LVCGRSMQPARTTPNTLADISLKIFMEVLLLVACTLYQRANGVPGLATGECAVDK